MLSSLFLCNFHNPFYPLITVQKHNTSFLLFFKNLPCSQHVFNNSQPVNLSQNYLLGNLNVILSISGDFSHLILQGSLHLILISILIPSAVKLLTPYLLEQSTAVILILSSKVLLQNIQSTSYSLHSCWYTSPSALKLLFLYSTTSINFTIWSICLKCFDTFSPSLLTKSSSLPHEPSSSFPFFSLIPLLPFPHCLQVGLYFFF